MKYLAVDLGDARTGLASGDSVTRIVTPLEVLDVPVRERGGEALLEAIANAAAEHLSPPGSPHAGGLVVGLPLNMDETEGPRAASVRAFAARLAAKTGHRVQFHDERLSSAAADWSMVRSGMTRGQKKQRRDALAAAGILRDFLGGSAGTPADNAPREPEGPSTI